MQLYTKGEELPNARIRAPYPKMFDFDEYTRTPPTLPLNAQISMSQRNARNVKAEARNDESLLRTETARMASTRGDEAVPDVGSPLEALHPFSDEEVQRAARAREFRMELEPISRALMECILETIRANNA
uniref:Uncharacterized protein n=1 Tax=Mycena chlorophos TaxID=658473 RepID=A0ABQ0L444_MYCCL|nr:predicted protein [Mycena chlorophos]